MTNKIEISRELAAFLEAHLSVTCTVNALPMLDELRALLAAPVVERQEPVALPMRRSWSGIAGWKDQAEIKAWNACLDEIAKLGPLYTSPPAPVAVPEGWKLVPVEPTELMIRRGDQNYSWSVSKIYKAMIEDAPACLDKVKEMNQ